MLKNSICKRQETETVVHAREGGRPLGQDGRVAHLNDSDNIGEAALQVVSIDDHAKGKAGAFVTVYQLADEPRTCEETSNTDMEATVSLPEEGRTRGTLQPPHLRPCTG